MTSFLKRALDNLSSVKLTLVCMAMAMILVLFGTLAQVKMGTFVAQDVYFNSWWVLGGFGGMLLPIFPGGLFIGALWLVNLVTAFAVRFTLRRRDTGILISHFGVILLLFGQLLAQIFARESMMPIEIGQSRNYTESSRDVELAVVRTSDPAFDEVTSVAQSRLRHEGPLALPDLPFSLVIRKYYPNALLRMGEASSTGLAATQGIGTRISVQPAPPVSTDDETNAATAFVEILEKGHSRGTWLLSSGLGAPQTLVSGGQTYELFIRPRRTYYPFSLTLKEFRHDLYPGTDIPKNFSSLVQLVDPQKQVHRQSLIYMNHPLRYDGKTFYQASFGKNDRLSVFQVVENPAAWTPYAACLLVALGLLIQFLWHLKEFMAKSR